MPSWQQYYMKHVCSTPKCMKQAEHYLCYQNDENTMVVPYINVEGWYCDPHAQEVADTIAIKVKEIAEAASDYHRKFGNNNKKNQYYSLSS